MTEIQKIILTCLLGPEDTTSFMREVSRLYSVEWRKNTPDHESRRTKDDSFREKRRLAQRKYVSRNPEIALSAERNARLKRRKEDPRYRLSLNLRRRLLLALNGEDKSDKTLALLGCSVEHWEFHLESKFVPGMTWENYGLVWHVDHVKPCAKFDLSNPEHQKLCFNWSNTQPLFAAENIAKGGR